MLGESTNKIATQTLIRLIAHDNAKLRQEAGKQLIRRKVERFDQLEELLKHQNWYIAWSAAFVLGSLGNVSVLPFMSDAIRSDSTSDLLAPYNEFERYKQIEIRLTAARILGSIDDEGSVLCLLDALHDDEPCVRREAAFSLSNFGRQEAIPELLFALNVGYLDDRTNGIRSLAKLNIEEPLWNILQTKETGWQTAAVELGKLGKAEVLPHLRQALVDLGYESSSEVIRLLSQFADLDTCNWLTNALDNPEPHRADPYFCNRIAFVLVECRSEIVVNQLPFLLKIVARKYLQQIFWIIPAIQANCQFYNYAIAQLKLTPHSPQRSLPIDLLAKIDQTTEDINQRTKQMAEQPKNDFSGATFQALVNFGDNPTGDFIGTQNNQTTNQEVKNAIADIQTLITQLQTQYPHVATETQALAILEVEFTEIKQDKTHKLATLRKQLLNPDRHFQAIKAALGEVAKHYLEESVLAKTTITYLDKLSEEPNHGA